MMNITIQLTDEELMFIMKKLKRMPWEEVEPLMHKIDSQRMAQLIPPPIPDAGEKG